MKIFTAIFIAIFLSSLGAFAQATNTLSEAEIQGRALAEKILEQRPATNFNITGVLHIRDTKGSHIECPFRSYASFSNSLIWISGYSADIKTKSNVIFGDWLVITHSDNQPNSYAWRKFSQGVAFHFRALQTDFETNYFGWPTSSPVDAGLMQTFANSDFTITDLGLEFFHWPSQKILKKEVHRSRGCIVLESTNPSPSPQSYLRVVSWIDEESLGVVEAMAYDAHGKKLKDFYPKDFAKINGQWQVQTLVMENLQTGSRSRIEFDLKK